MRDLKHLIYFENLLENADNELVKQAQADGKLAVGYTCYHVPEALLNVGNCFSVRLRAPRTGSLDIATYYMSNYTCEFARALVERGMEGGFQFLDALAGVDACSMMNRAMEHFEILQLNSKPNFFVSHCDIPYKITDYTLDSYVSQMRIHVLDELKNRYGVDTSDDAIRAAVAQHNEVCRIISEIGEMRKADNPVITGYEFHVLNLVTYTCPKDLILPYLRETLEELKARQPRREARLPGQSRHRGQRDRRSPADQAHRGLRRPGGVRPLLLRLHPRPRGHRTEGRRGSPAPAVPARDAALRVRPVYRRREGPAAPGYCRPSGPGVQGRRHHL